MYLSRMCAVLNSPVTEEQAWAICYQCLESVQAQIGSSSADGSPLGLYCGQISTDSIYLSEYGGVTLNTVKASEGHSFKAESEILYYVGTSIYQALDYGISENEERQLSPELEFLIQEMVADVLDEGISDDGDGRSQIRLILQLCTAHLQSGVLGEIYYRDVVFQMVTEAKHLESVIAKVSHSFRECELENQVVPDPKVACTWLRVLDEIRKSRYRLENVDEEILKERKRKSEMALRERLMSDIRSQRVKLRRIMVDGEPPQATGKEVHCLTMQLIRGIPQLRPVSERPLNPTPPRTFTPRELLLREVRQKRPKLRRVLPPATRGSVELPEKSLVSANKHTVTGNKMGELRAVQTSPYRRRLKADRALVDAIANYSDEGDLCRSVTFSPEKEGSPSKEQNQSLSLRDIIHIRSVIIKGKLNEAEYGPNLTLFLDLQDGKVCFCCQQRRFSPFGAGSETCHLCGQKVCSDCLKVKVSDQRKSSSRNGTTPPRSPTKKIKKHSTGKLCSWSSLPSLLPMLSPGKKKTEKTPRKTRLSSPRIKVTTPARMSSWTSLPSLVSQLTLSSRLSRVEKSKSVSAKTKRFPLRPEDLELCKRLDMCRDCAALVERAAINSA